MIQITAAVEDDATDTFFQCALCNRLADPPGRINVTTGGSSQILLGRGRRYDRLTKLIVNYLGVDMIQAAINSQSRPITAARYFAANSPVNRLANYCSTRVCHFFLVNRKS